MTSHKILAAWRRLVNLPDIGAVEQRSGRLASGPSQRCWSGMIRSLNTGSVRRLTKSKPPKRREGRFVDLEPVR